MMTNKHITGTVKYQSSNRVAVITDHGYTVFDIEHGELSIGDRVTGCLGVHGHQDLTNQTTGHKFSVHIEAIQATQQAALNLLRNI